MGKYHRIVILLWISINTLEITVTSAKSSWTSWYNSDSPYDGVEEETIEQVREKVKDYCSGGSISEAECREVRTTVTFTNQPKFSTNTFHVPCNATGLVCRDRDQPGNVFCSDYEIRFFCRGYQCISIDGGGCSPDADSSAIYDGGFIAMAAGLSVIIPLICVLIVQLRRAKTQRRREQNAQNAQANNDTTSHSRYNDPPPTYEQLFGEQSVLERYDSRSGLLPDSSSNSGSSHGRSSVSSEGSQSDGSISTISGDIVDDRSGIDNPALDTVMVENEVESRPRRFLGMHISIHDLFNYSDPVISTPPPSYNEALEILKMSPQALQKLSEVPT